MWITLCVKEAPGRGRIFGAGWRGMPPEVQFECAGGAEQFAKPHPPLRGPYLFCLGRKDMEEKTVRTRNSAVAPEK